MAEGRCQQEAAGPGDKTEQERSIEACWSCTPRGTDCQIHGRGALTLETHTLEGLGVRSRDVFTVLPGGSGKSTSAGGEGNSDAVSSAAIRAKNHRAFSILPASLSA